MNCSEENQQRLEINAFLKKNCSIDYPEWKDIGTHTFSYVFLPQEYFARTIEEAYDYATELENKGETFTVYKLFGDRYISSAALIKHSNHDLKPNKNSIGKSFVTDISTAEWATTFCGKITGVTDKKYKVEGENFNIETELYPSECYRTRPESSQEYSFSAKEIINFMEKTIDETESIFVKHLSKEFGIDLKDISCSTEYDYWHNLNMVTINRELWIGNEKYTRIKEEMIGEIDG